MGKESVAVVPLICAGNTLLIRPAGAVTFLAYFHYCNKGVFPFSEECREQDLKNLAELDDQAMQFVRYTRSYAADHSK